MTDIIHQNLSAAFELCESQWLLTCHNESIGQSVKLELLENYSKVSKRLGDYYSLTGDLENAILKYQKSIDIRLRISNHALDRELAEL